jgi:acetamidase/formamidase
MARAHRLGADVVQYEWNNAIPPRLVVDPGDTVVLETRDAADGYYTPASTSADTAARGPFKGHPLTGPIAIRGAAPGDVLAVEVLDVRPAAAFGWTHIRPGRGLLPERDFPAPFLQLWDLTDGAFARMTARSGARIAVPIAAFPGVVGTALDEPGSHSTMPPRKNGGNMDVKQLTAGAIAYLPVWVDGALLSVGDAHAAQGDGEVCVSAVEMAAHVTLRLDLGRGRALREPQLRTSGALDPGARRGPEFATTAHGPDLFAAAQQATRYLIEHLVAERGLLREEAYVLASVAADLRISEIVDAPNWIVAAFLPESVFA